MRFLIALPVVGMIAFTLFAVWDLRVTGFAPPIPADELAENNTEISDILAPHRMSLLTEMSGTVLPQIEDSLEVIGNEYGDLSPEYNQALVETALLLNENKRPDLATFYMKKAVKVSEHVYGPEHRETAMTLHDLANLLTESINANYSDEAIGYLERALDIRRNVLAEGHDETIATEVGLADQLYLQWQATGTPEENSQLQKASALLKSAVESQEANKPENDITRVATGLLYARVAFSAEDYAVAEEYFRKTLSPVAASTDPATFVVLNNAYSEYIVALRKIGQNQRADKMQAEIIRFIKDARSPAPAPRVATEDETPTSASDSEIIQDIEDLLEDDSAGSTSLSREQAANSSEETE